MLRKKAHRAYKLNELTNILFEQNLLSKRQATDLMARKAVLKERILRKRESDGTKAYPDKSQVSPAEIIAAAQCLTPGKKLLTEDLIMEAMAMASGFSYLKIDPLKLNARVVTSILNKPFAFRNVCLPISKSNAGKITFAVDNPYNFELKESLRGLLRTEFEFVLSSKTDILRVITEIYGFRNAVQAAEEDLDTGADIGNLEQLVSLNGSRDLEATDQHIVKAVDHLLRYAFDQKASDIHIEPKRESAHVRLRIDGLLHTVYRFPRVVHNAVVSRLKMLSRMDISERRRPQDGRIKTEWSGRETELRVSSLPVAFGEKIVVRIFDPKSLFHEPNELGFCSFGLEHYNQFLQKKTGLILVTGPTGSGKTTTLYSTLKQLSRPDINITTIEDPIELIHESFNQTMVHQKIGMTFASILRTVLRQDPDIVMLGEIRDEETAQMSVQAALTGHLVLSTLHTNDAPSAVTRLQDLGVPNFLLSSTLVGVIAQRLMRKVCKDCKTEITLTEEQAVLLGLDYHEGDEPLPTWKGEGCSSCRQTGLSGRAGVFEVLPIEKNIRKLIGEGADALTIRQEAIANGMPTLRESSIRKLASGATSFDEIVRLLGDHELGRAH